jgi:hypothetical protein
MKEYHLYDDAEVPKIITGFCRICNRRNAHMAYKVTFKIEDGERKQIIDYYDCVEMCDYRIAQEKLGRSLCSVRHAIERR